MADRNKKTIYIGEYTARPVIGATLSILLLALS